MSEWQPITTAPDDGKCIVWCDTDDGGEALIMPRDQQGNWIYEGEPTFRTPFYIEPTHWMPLPLAPATLA